MELIKEKLVNYRVLSNVLLAAITVTLVAGVSAYFLLQRPNYIQEGSFETDRAQEEWTYEEVIGEPSARLVVDPYWARDGFRAAVLSIGSKESGIERRFKQDVSVWFDTKYRLKFSYLFTEEELGNARLYVEVLEWDIFKEDWKRVRKDFQPMVSNTWMEQEYEFEVSGTARKITVIFGLLNNPGTVLIDNVRLELAASVWEIVERPYLLEDVRKLNPNNYLPLEKWAETQPQENRSFLRTNAGVAQANGWAGKCKNVGGSSMGCRDRCTARVGSGSCDVRAAADGGADSACEGAGVRHERRNAVAGDISGSDVLSLAL